MVIVYANKADFPDGMILKPLLKRKPGLRTRSNFIRVRPILASPSSSSSSLI